MQEKFLAEQKLQQLRQKMEMMEKLLGDASDDVEFWKGLGLSAGLVVEEEGSSSHMGSPVDQGWEGQN
jgi:DNA-binding transcriptional regulator WhiA